MAMSANVVEAIKILHAAQADLTDAVRLGYTTAVVVPGAVPAPEEGTIVGLSTAGIPSPTAIRSVVMPEDKYAAWRMAWEVLVAYAGWWGKPARWPLGDGDRAKKDPITAMNMPPLGAGLAALTATLISIEAPTWQPEIRVSAIAALLLFLGGAGYAYQTSTHRRGA